MGKALELLRLFEEDQTFTPPSAVAAEAKKAIGWKEKYKDEVKGGTQVGWVRASQLAKRDKISLKTIKRMKSFFDRHEKNKNVASDKKESPWRDNGHIAWLIWGGDAGRSWAEKILGASDE